MKQRILWTLVVLNVALAVSLVLRFTHDDTANAQVRRPADYILVPGEVTGGASEVVYMVDITNGWLGAMAYDVAVRTYERSMRRPTVPCSCASTSRCASSVRRWYSTR